MWVYFDGVWAHHPVPKQYLFCDGDKFCHFLFASLADETLPNKSAAGIAWCPATALTSSEVTVLNLCTSSSHALYCTKFCEIIWNDIKVIEWTWFLYWKFQRDIILQKDTISILTTYKITKWHKTEKTVKGVTVHKQSLVILYLYQVSWNDLKPYQSYRADTISMP